MYSENGLRKIDRKRMLFVYNPMAGKEQIKNKLSDIIQVFCEAGFLVTMMATQKKNDARDAVIAYGRDFDYIVCSGGDGTMNEVATGMMHLDDKPICGYIPAGTVNDFASSLKIPKIMKRAAKLVTEGEVFQSDIGGFNDRFFTYVAGFGAFTEVSYQTPQEWKNMLGKSAYFIEGIKHLSEIKPHHMKIEYDGNIVEDDFILGLISNSVSVAGFKAYKKEKIKMDDGLLEGLFIRDLKNILEIQEVLNVLMTKNLDAPEIFRFRSNRIRIISDDVVSWTLDGEDGGNYDEVILKNHQQALPIICGPKAIQEVSMLPPKETVREKPKPIFEMIMEGLNLGDFTESTTEEQKKNDD